MADKDPLTAAAEAAAKELVKSAYGDLLQPTAQEVGGLFHEFVQTVIVAGRGFGYLIRERYEPLVLRAINAVPEEQRILPRPEILGSILEGATYHPSESDLAKMFEALLSASMDKNRFKEVHPSYPNIVSQLSADEARLLIGLLNNDLQGEVIRGLDRDPEFIPTPECIPADVEVENVDFCVDHLGALGLVFTEIGNNLRDRRSFEGGWAEKATVYLQPLGKRFIRTCRPSS